MRRLSLLAALTAVFVISGCSKQVADEAAQELPPLGDTSSAVAGALVVDFKDGTTKAEYDAWEKDWNVDVEFNSVAGAQSGIALAVGVSDVDAVLAKIRGNPNVESAEPLFTYDIPEGFESIGEDEVDLPAGTGFPNDPLWTKQWNMKQIDVEKAWQRSKGKGAVVAVLDTGIAYEDHDGLTQVEDLKGAKFSKGYDFVNDDEHANDDHGHGTHVAGTIAQVTNNGKGVTGVAYEATLMPVKVLNHFGSGTSADIADAIRWAADNGANVINMSLGGGGRSSVMESAVAYARKKGVTVVCAAGNGGRGVVEYPAAYDGAVAVSAVGPTKELAPYSSWGKQLDIAAPGGDKSRGLEFGVLQNTIDPKDNTRGVYAFYNGTSMATPHVAGVAALIYAAGAKTPDEVEKALYEGAAKVSGQEGWNDRFGHGLLNAPGALAAYRGGGSLNWSPFLWAALLLMAVLMTITRRERPGYFNIFFKGSFIAPLVLTTVGFFVGRWIANMFGSSAAADVFDASAIPIPDWERIIFGRGKLANPLFYSALIPIGFSILGIKWNAWRPAIGGLAIGFAGFLAYAAFSRAPGLAYMPFTFLAMPWLILNTVICLFIGRAMIKKSEGVK